MCALLGPTFVLRQFLSWRDTTREAGVRCPLGCLDTSSFVSGPIREPQSTVVTDFDRGPACHLRRIFRRSGNHRTQSNGAEGVNVRRRVSEISDVLRSAAFVVSSVCARLPVKYEW